MVEHGVLAIEMEASALYTIAAGHGRKALAICTVSDHIVTGEETSSRGARAHLRRHGRDSAGRRARLSPASWAVVGQPEARSGSAGAVSQQPSRDPAETDRGCQLTATRARAAVSRQPADGLSRSPGVHPVVEILDAVVIGAGQAGLSTSYHLGRRGIDHVVLDADGAPGGAWQHRWDSLTMQDVHGISALPDAEPPVEQEGRANDVVPTYFADYERAHHLPVLRPVRVDEVVDAGDGLLEVRAGDRRWRTRTVVNATGTWSRPFVPSYPGASTFRGRQLHTHDYPGPSRSAAGGWSSSAAAPRRCSCSARSPRWRRTRCGSPAASRSGAPTTSRRRSAGPRSRSSRSGYGGGCHRPAS